MVTTFTAEASSVLECTHSWTRKKRVELWQHYGISGQHQTDHHSELENEIIIRKIEQAVVGLPEYVSKQLTGLFQLSPENALNIIDFILTQKTEVNISDTYRLNTISTLVLLSKFLNHKAFIDMKREDILLYLDSLRKQEAFDPLHKWVGSYNVKRQRFIKFFRWLYNPDKTPLARQTPEFMEQIRSLKRKEQSIYKPTDLWTNEDDLLFLKFCPSKRDKCYHAVSRDASGRPHEILGIKLRSVVFKVTADNKQYAEVLINGKTGSRSIPLFDSIPHIKDWISSHPQPGNPNALLFPSLSHQTFGRKLTSSAVGCIYRRYKTQFFPQLLIDPNVASEDKNKIRELLKKPWNPYIRRHSALTEKSTILREHTLRQHAGWSPRSNMHMKYLHYFGNESNDSLLEAYGIVTKDPNQLSVLRPKQCPNCNEPNKPDSKFCTKCKMVLTYDAYSETLESEKQKEDRLTMMEEQFNTMQSQLQTLITSLGNIKDQNQINSVAASLFSSGILKPATATQY